MLPGPPSSTLFPYTTLFRSIAVGDFDCSEGQADGIPIRVCGRPAWKPYTQAAQTRMGIDRKSTRLNSSHANISYAVFRLKKKNSPRFSFIRQAFLCNRGFIS